MKSLWQAADFIRRMRRRMRFGELSRAPLRLLRLQIQGEIVECDWIVRPPDVFDAGLSRPTRERHVAWQALADALVLRDLLFSELPDAQTVVLRAFRQPAREPPELMIVGTMGRESWSELKSASLVMKAKLSGFQFLLDDGMLQPLQQN